MLKPRTLKVAAARALCRLHDARGVDALRDVLRAFRSDGRSYAVQVVGELAIHELAGELLRLAHRQRGVDPAVLVEALAALLPESAPARAGLTLLARRNDEAGEQARQALGSRACVIRVHIFHTKPTTRRMFPGPASARTLDVVSCGRILCARFARDTYS